MHTAHEQGIVHRDIKPGNVMVLSRAGDVFLQAQLSIVDAVDVFDPTAPTFFNPGSPPTSNDVTACSRAKANVLGNNITLVATLGTVGELGNDLDVDSDYSNPSVVGTLTSTSSDNTFVSETAGDLWLNTVTAGSGATAFNSMRCSRTRLGFIANT